MKKIKYLLVCLLVFLVTGCVDAKIDINLKNDDTGTIKYVAAYEKSFIESSGGEMEDSFTNPPEGATVKDVTYKKGDKDYVGQEMTINFTSLEELNNIIAKMDEEEETEEGEETPSISSITLQRDGSKVTLTSAANPDSYEQVKSMLSVIDYNVTVTVEGKVVSNNATEYDKDTKVMTWNLETALKNGINLVYTTDSSSTKNNGGSSDSAKIDWTSPLNIAMYCVIVLGFASLIFILTRKNK